MKPIHYGALLALGAIWGASFLFIHIAAPYFGPLALMSARVMIAAVILLSYAALMRSLPDFRHNWHRFLVVGTLNAAMPFSLIAFSELTLTSSLAAILNSTTPLFTALVAAVWIGEQLTWRKLLGIFLGMTGVVILVGGSALEINAELIVAALASLTAALCYGLGTVYASRNFGGGKPLHNAIGQLLGASAALLIPAGATLPQEAPPTNAVLALLALAVISTSVAYLIYFFLLNNVGPTRTATVTFLVPVFGTLWGALFLGDAITPGMLLGMVIILGSVRLVISARGKTRPTFAPHPAAK